MDPRPEVVEAESPTDCIDALEGALAGSVVHAPRSTPEASELVRAVEERDDPWAVLLLVERPDAALLASCCDHAAVRLLPWPAGADELGAQVRRALEHGDEIRRVRRALCEQEERFGSVTGRELEVLQLLSQGHSSKSTAAELGISKRTVDDHRSALLHKTRCATTAAMVHALDRLELLRWRDHALTRGPWRPPRRASPRSGDPVQSVPACLEPESPPAPPARGGAAGSRPGTEMETEAAAARLGGVLRDLEQSADRACLLDGDLRVLWSNPAWRGGRPPAAPEPSGGVGPCPGTRWGLGARYVDAISPPLSGWFEQQLTDALDRDRAWRHDYECPTPAYRRRWRLTATPVGGALVLRHSLLDSRPFEELRTLDPELEHEHRNRQGAVLQCMECRRVQSLASGCWSLVAEWIAAPPAQTRWVLCGACEGTVAEA